MCCTKLTAIKCVSGTRKLSITADDQLVELYVDGVATTFQPGGWGTVRVVDIPEDTQVIAVKAIDVAKVSSIVSFESAFFASCVMQRLTHTCSVTDGTTSCVIDFLSQHL